MKQPEALRLACELEQAPYSSPCTNDAATELRRLLASNEELMHCLKYIQTQTHIGHIHDTASAAIAKGEQE